MISASRKIDQLGRLLVPAEFRKMLGIRNGDVLEMRVENDALVIQKTAPECAICGGSERLVGLHDKQICSECVSAIRNEPQCAICGRIEELVELHDRHVCKGCVEELSVV